MTYVHTVCFTCKPGTSPAAMDAQIADATALLGRIPTVKLIHSGRRDVEQQRTVSVTDWEIGLVVICDDKPGYQVYADHQLHLDYIARHNKIWDRVRVFDFQA